MGTNRNIKQEDWNLLAKELFDKPAGKSDITSIQSELLSVNDAEQAHITHLSQQIDLHFKLKEYKTSEALQLIKSRIQKQKSRANSRITLLRAIKIAAVLLIAIVMGSTAYFMSQKQLVKKNMAEVIVNNLGLSQIELPDGTIVSLNRDTKINYPDKFGDDIREVSIEGEAFFEVTPNPSKPFIIHAGEATIKVLGTSFSVNAYPENDMVEVIVETGKVKFSKQQTNQQTTHEVILDPGEKGTYVNASKELIKSTNNDPNFLAWKTHKLIFSETSLKEVIKQLNKVYRVRIETADPNLDNLLLNAHFEDESLDFILEVISTTHGLKFDKQGEHYLLKKEA